MANKTKVILSNEQEVIVSKLKVRQIRSLAKLLSKIPEDTFRDENSLALTITSIAELVGTYFDDIIDLIAGCVDLPLEELENLPIDDMVELIKTIYEVNKDFLGKYFQMTEE